MSKKLTQEEFEKRVYDVTGDEYTVVGEYKTSTTKIRMRHNNCSCKEGFYEWDTTPHNFINNGRRCPVEGKQHSVITIDVIQDRLSKYHPGYVLLSKEYKKSDIPLDIQCDKGHIYHALLNSITNGLGCVYCANQKAYKGETDLWTTHPEIAKCLKNPSDGYLYMFYTRKELDFICPNCGQEHHKIPSLFMNKNGSIVCKCGDGFSYPEKYVTSLLEQLNINYIYQLSNKHFNWCDKYKYDFYLSNYNLIIEVHGMQHYINCSWGRKDIDVIKNDKIKEQLAISNGIDYLVLDARYSKPLFIKNNILNSKLNLLFDLNKINWDKCGIDASNSLVIEVAKLWNEGNNNVPKLAEKLGISDTTVKRYLIQSAELNLTNFDIIKHRKDVNHGAKRKPIRCIETGIIYPSFCAVKNELGIQLTENKIKQNNFRCGYHWELVSA